MFRIHKVLLVVLFAFFFGCRSILFWSSQTKSKSGLPQVRSVCGGQDVLISHKREASLPLESQSFDMHSLWLLNPINGPQPSSNCEDWNFERQRYCQGHRCKKEYTISKSPNHSVEACRTLWFAGFSIRESNPHGGYASHYAAALRSAMVFAEDTLQPVFLVDRYGYEKEVLPPILDWAADQGAIVIIIDRLSFHDLIMNFTEEQQKSGPGQYMRLDIPAIVKQHNLINYPGVCQRHVLYTDCDILFASPIRHSDLDLVKKTISQKEDAYITYGFEGKHSGHPVNTGVMMIDIPRFEEEWSSILEFGRTHGPFRAADQGWLNRYFESTTARLRNRTLLGGEWNWKVYWMLEPNSLDQIKVIHFHGPKPGKGVWEIAECNTTSTRFPRFSHLFHEGICCDHGKTAHFALRLHSALSPPSNITSWG